MKVTKTQLKEIIREELSHLDEMQGDPIGGLLQHLKLGATKAQRLPPERQYDSLARTVQEAIDILRQHAIAQG
jgi:hypothetical protein